jgi:hypothetical protein
MNVGALDAEVHDPKVLAPRGGERGLADRPIDTPAAQVTDRADDPQHDMDGMPRVEIRPLLVRSTGPLALWPPTRAAPLATTLPRRIQS